MKIDARLLLLLNFQISCFSFVCLCHEERNFLMRCRILFYEDKLFCIKNFIEVMGESN